MTKHFTGKIQGETFEDRALFEVAAKTWRAPKTAARKEFGIAPTKGEAESEIRSIRRGWKTPAPKPFEDPMGLEIGAEVLVTYSVRRGEERLLREDVSAQVWSLAIGGVWVADGEHFIRLDKRGEVVEVQSAGGGFVGNAFGRVVAQVAA